MATHDRQESNRVDEHVFRLLVDGVREFAIFLFNPERVLLTWNEGVGCVMGYSREEFVGQLGDMIFTEEDRAKGVPEEEVATAERDGQARDERWHLKKDGSLFWASGIVTKLCDPSGRLIGFSKVVTDRTEEKKAQELLQEARKELETRVAERTRELADALEAVKKEMAHREELEIALLEATEKERERLGQELHDGACQHLQGTALITSVLARRLSKPQGEELRTIENLIREGAELVRYVARGLSPFTLRSIGLRAALAELAEHTNKAVPCHFEHTGNIDVANGPALHLFRIAQEAVNNALKHAEATAITITLSQGVNGIELSIQDNGKGSDLEFGEVFGMGLQGMRQRARLLGGALNVENLSSGGTRVVCSVPVKLKNPA